MDKTILKYIEANKWDKIIKLIKNKKFVDINKPLINSNNLFHLACINLKPKIIKTLLDMKNKNQIKLNTNLLNNDGIPGIHLYYKYGGTDISILDKAIICQIDLYSNTILNYVIDNLELLDKFIDRMIESKCITNLYFITDVNKSFFTKLTQKINDNIKYKKIMEKIYREVKPINFINISLYENSVHNLAILIDSKHDFMKYEMHFLPLATAIRFDKLTMITLILQYTENNFGLSAIHKMIHSSKYDYDKYPIFVAIQFNSYGSLYILKTYMEKILEKDFDIYYDTRHNTYLHRLIYMNNINENVEILKFFIKHTNLNKKNYIGHTCGYLLFYTGLWKLVINELKSREIDITNITQFIKKEDTDLFDNLRRTLKEPIEVKNKIELDKLYNVSEIKKILNIKDTITHYGVYRNRITDIIIYLKYLQSINVHIPVLNYDENNKKEFLYINEMTNMNNNLINSELTYYVEVYYTFLSTFIFWQDKNHYYCHLVHNNILKNNKQRFIYIHICILLSDVYSHANCFIYDTKTQNGYYFEPYGMTNVYNDNNDGIDKLLIDIFEKEFGKVNFYYPEDYMKNINFQLVSKDNINMYQNVGDPGGYCLAWCIWFAEIIVKYPDIEIKTLMKNFINRENINLLLTENDIKTIKSDNYYLDFIRLYGKKLTMEKNRIMSGLGISNYELFKNVFSNDTYDIISKYINQ
jgi:hypothetical protein